MDKTPFEGTRGEYIQKYLLSRPALVKKTAAYLTQFVPPHATVVDLGSGPQIGKFSSTQLEKLRENSFSRPLLGIRFSRRQKHRRCSLDAFTFVENFEEKADVVLLLRSLHHLAREKKD